VRGDLKALFAKSGVTAAANWWHASSRITTTTS
jgi:hypothetical protein